ncbi:MAG: hypothetical protein VZS44_08845 [Bacilli bacterium]|nr:hypothetical protein [Bacilli bacterium]
MTLEEKLKILLLKIIYNKLGLSEIENEFIKNNINSKDIENKDNIDLISKYFFLKNDIHLENLTKDEEELLKTYIDNNDIKNINTFLENNLKKILLPNEKVRMIHYNGNDYTKMAPSDAIVLQFHYREFDNYDKHDDNERLINSKLNYIQSTLGPNNGLKVAVLKYNELVTDYIKRL